jgi:hypothetical protein
MRHGDIFKKIMTRQQLQDDASHDIRHHARMAA